MSDLPQLLTLATSGDELMVENAVNRCLEYWKSHACYDLLKLIVQIFQQVHPFRSDLVLKIFDRVFDEKGTFYRLVFLNLETSPSSRSEDIVLFFLRYGADPEKILRCIHLYRSLADFQNFEFVMRPVLRTLYYHPHPETSRAMVPRLKHICKLKVREILKMANLLPAGIYDLWVPREIMEYLDLLRDE